MAGLLGEAASALADLGEYAPVSFSMGVIAMRVLVDVKELCGRAPESQVKI